MLIGLRDFEDDKADVLTRFREDEARQLKAYGELPESGMNYIYIYIYIYI